MTKLTQDQKENLAELIGEPAWQAVLSLCQIAIENCESRVLTCDTTTTDRDLIRKKFQLEGAIDVQRALMNVRKHIGAAKKQEG